MSASRISIVVCCSNGPNCYDCTTYLHPCLLTLFTLTGKIGLALSFILEIVFLWILYFLIVLLKQFIGEVVLVIYWVIAHKIFKIFIFHFVNDATVFFRRSAVFLFRLILESLGLIREYIITFLNLPEYFCCIRLFTKIGMIFFDQLKVRSFKLLFSEVERQVEQLVVIRQLSFSSS